MRATLAVPGAVLVSLDKCHSAGAAVLAEADAGAWRCTTAECTKQPVKDVLASPCLACRAWAQAIKALHRKPRSLSLDSWRNGATQHWSSANEAVAALAVAKVYTCGGSQAVESFAGLDFAALVNIVDFCVGLCAQDSPQWQPQGPKDDHKLLDRVLQPARVARNKFAHNSQLVFDSEAAAAEAITALLVLVNMLPVVEGSRREDVVRCLKCMRDLGASDSTSSAEPVSLQGMRSQLSSMDAESAKEFVSVLDYLRDACLRDVSQLQATMDADAFRQGSASVPRRAGTTHTALAHSPDTGGSGSSGGTGTGTGTGSGGGGEGAQGFGEGPSPWQAHDGVDEPHALQRLLNVQRALARAESVQAWLRE